MLPSYEEDTYTCICDVYCKGKHCGETGEIKLVICSNSYQNSVRGRRREGGARKGEDVCGRGGGGLHQLLTHLLNFLTYKEKVSNPTDVLGYHYNETSFLSVFK